MSDELDVLRIRREQMVRNEISQSKKEKLDEIIDHMNLIHEKILNVQDTIDQDVLEVIQKLEKFRDEEL